MTYHCIYNNWRIPILPKKALKMYMQSAPHSIKVRAPKSGFEFLRICLKFDNLDYVGVIGFNLSPNWEALHLSSIYGLVLPK